MNALTVHETVNIGTSIYITKVVNIMNKFLYPNNSKIYDKEPQYNETLL